MTREIRAAGIAIATAFAFIVGLSCVSTAAAQALASQSASAPSKSLVEFTAEGKLKQPVGYREWVYIGTPLTPNDLNDGEAAFPEFHAVYIDAQSFADYKKTGQFRDGTILVKELSSVGAKQATSGKGYFMGEFTGLEVSIKDSKRFKDEPGNWAYFSFGHHYPLKPEVAKNTAAACNKCHQNSAEQDYVFTQFYPVLRAAAPKTE